MQTVEYPIFVENTETLVDGVAYALTVNYVKFNNSKIITLTYNRKTNISIASGNNALQNCSEYITTPYRPSTNVTCAFGRIVITLTSDGNLTSYNQGNAVNFSGKLSFTYIV